MRRLLACVGLAVPALVVYQSCLAADLPSASSWLPAETPLVFEATEPMTLLGPLFASEVAKAVTASATNRTQNLKLQQLQGIVAYLELQLGTSWRLGLERLLGRNATIALGPGGEALLCADGQDDKLLEKLHETARHFATTEAMKQQQPERVASKEYQGVTAWTLGENEAHAILGTRLLLSNRREVLKRALDLRAESNGKDLASSALYKAAHEAVGRDTAAWLYVNMETARQAPALKAALAREGNPIGTLLMADTQEALSAAKWLAVGLYVREGKLVLKAYTDGEAPATSKAAAFATAREAGDGVMPNLAVPGRIANLSLYRDLRAFYAAKDDLFPERTSGLVFFENMMGIFFSGTELTDGVLGQTRPDIRIVVASQKYDPSVGTPAVQMPAFAAVMRLRDPQKFGPAVEEGWQKALGLINFTRGQKAEPGLVIDRATHSDVKFTYAYYRPTEAKDNGVVDERFNYRPSVALTGDYLIFSSTDGLTADLIDALKKEAVSAAKPSGPTHAVLQVDGVQLRSILARNRESMIRKNMVEKGNAREQAETDISGFLTLLDCLEEGKLSLDRDGGRPRATLELKLKTPTTLP